MHRDAMDAIGSTLKDDWPSWYRKSFADISQPVGSGSNTGDDAPHGRATTEEALPSGGGSAGDGAPDSSARTGEALPAGGGSASDGAPDGGATRGEALTDVGD